MFNDSRFPENIWLRIHVVPQTCCWLWTGSINKDSYGSVKIAKKTYAIHRLFYETYKGPIPLGAEIDHLCRVRNCCNPDHLEPVSHQTNIDRGDGRKGSFKRLSCIRGHPYTAENTYISPKGIRACRICRKINTDRSKAKNIEKVRERDRIIHVRRYQEHRDELLTKQKEYNERNKEKARERMRIYYENNKEKWKQYKH